MTATFTVHSRGNMAAPANGREEGKDLRDQRDVPLECGLNKVWSKVEIQGSPADPQRARLTRLTGTSLTRSRLGTERLGDIGEITTFV